MTKRGWLKLAATFFGQLRFGNSAIANSNNMPKSPEINLDGLKDFPFEYVTTDGANAQAAWETLKTAGRGIPVIVGGDEDILGLFEFMNFDKTLSAESVLKKADEIQASFDIAKFRKDEAEALDARMKALGKSFDFETTEPELGDWPDEPEVMSTPTIPFDILTNKPLPRVHIVLVPAKSSTDIPAYFHWGNWNECPPPEVHVALLRQWQKEYGAELVGMTRDVLNIRVANRPATKVQATELAKKQYRYCADIVDQGTGDLLPLAATLFASHWWYFWWD